MAVYSPQGEPDYSLIDTKFINLRGNIENQYQNLHTPRILARDADYNVLYDSFGDAIFVLKDDGSLRWEKKISAKYSGIDGADLGSNNLLAVVTRNHVEIYDSSGQIFSENEILQSANLIDVAFSKDGKSLLFSSAKYNTHGTTDEEGLFLGRYDLTTSSIIWKTFIKDKSENYGSYLSTVDLMATEGGYFLASLSSERLLGYDNSGELVLDTSVDDFPFTPDPVWRRKDNSFQLYKVNNIVWSQVLSTGDIFIIEGGSHK
ncbi:MAG: hypothetical protein KDD13_13045 [Mangrovimonas sp.]|nr:hypothetical protein [Mangrovimonas sp.]